MKSMDGLNKTTVYFAITNLHYEIIINREKTMNEKELLERLSRQKPSVTVHDREGKIDELKPVVPQFVADWYEENKDDFEFNVQCLCVHSFESVREIDTWFDSER